MKNSASYSNLEDISDSQPIPPKLKRASTYSHQRNEDGEFILMIKISIGYLTENDFYTLSPSSDLSSPLIGVVILSDMTNQTSTEQIEEDDDDVIVINYPTMSIRDIWSKINIQQLEAMKGDYKAIGLWDSF